ncbi:hypothetical protein GBF38_005028 [Nibea albiflora]|uniref:Uncharacterized protein n=1 Tax=Nibea albiflora TaxID=240163 RepID=A0ACB7EVN1_NIBAL|nr:hypothetical protein GBF38_005028 [Nibea albiflora]
MCACVGKELTLVTQPVCDQRRRRGSESEAIEESSMLQPKIQPSDGLSFRTCTVFIFMVLQSVGGAASDPSTMGRSIETGGMIVVCEAKGWYPEPELFWLDGEGNLLSAGPTETVRGPDDLYTVSRRLTVRKSDSFTCRVQQKNINQTRETHFYVPG